MLAFGLRDVSHGFVTESFESYDGTFGSEKIFYTSDGGLKWEVGWTGVDYQYSGAFMRVVEILQTGVKKNCSDAADLIFPFEILLTMNCIKNRTTEFLEDAEKWKHTSEESRKELWRSV